MNPIAASDFRSSGSDTPPSIFNDVIGPVMRGPSSSHCAAAVRIGRLARDLMGGDVRKILVEFHPEGSLATTHETQGSDMGLFGGLMGWDATDSRLIDSAQIIREIGIDIQIRIAEFPATHPNTYRMTLTNSTTSHRMTAISTGGGMVEVVEIDGIPLSISGDAHETLGFLELGIGHGGSSAEGVWTGILPRDFRAEENEECEFLIHEGPEGIIFRIRGSSFPSPSFRSQLASAKGVREVRMISPVLPISTPREFEIPFITCAELLEFNRDRDLELWELGVEYEAARGGIETEAVMDRMEEIVRILEGALKEGIEGTDYPDRILGPQAPTFQRHMAQDPAVGSGGMLDGGILNHIILAVTAMMEVKSAMGVIVAAPTAGACGALPGTCLGTAQAMGLGRDAVIRGMLAAGVVGLFIASRSTFAAEVCGCQAECGSGSGMAAAALVTLAGGTTEQALSAASMALQNSLGMICDPVANRVEVPCLGRNVMAAGNALSSANMALAGFDSVVPLDEVIETMDLVGKSIPHELRCTALGGLSITPTSQRITMELTENQPNLWR